MTTSPTTERFLGWPAALLASAFVPAAWVLGNGATLALYVGFNVLFNAPHQMATWVRASREPARARFLVIALIVLLFSLALHLAKPHTNFIIADVLTYWGIWHLISQHFGISQVLRARGGEAAGNRQWHRAYFFVLHAAGILYLHATSDLTITLGDDVTRMLKLPLPDAARPVLAIAMVASFVVAAIVRLAPAWRSNRARFHYEASSTAAIALGLFFSPNLMITIAVLTGLHNIHYIALVKTTIAHDGGAKPSWRHAVLAMGYSALIHAFFFVGPIFGNTIFLGAVCTHYVVDGQLWRLRDNPRLARALRLSLSSPT